MGKQTPALKNKKSAGRTSSTVKRISSPFVRTTAKRSKVKAHQTSQGQPEKFDKYSPTALYNATGFDYVEIVRRGVPAKSLNVIIENMHIPKDRLFNSLRIPRSTVERKIRNNETLSAEQSERVFGLERLVGQVEVMVAQSGNPEGFDANRWVGEWLDSPLPALGGAKPADYMDTMEGQKIVSNLLALSQSGAYA